MHTLDLNEHKEHDRENVRRNIDLQRLLSVITQMLGKDTKPTPLLKKGDKNKPLKQHMFTQKYHPDRWREGSTTIISKQIESYDKLRLDQLWVQSNKNQRLVRKFYGLVEVIHKIRKTSYRIQLLLWIQTNPVVHVSNLKCYYSDQENIK